MAENEAKRDERASSVLVAEDEADMRSGLRESLAKHGYSVDTAEDGMQAAKRIEGKSYDIVIADLKMPGLDGLAVLRRAKEISPQTALIVITGYGTTESAVKAIRLGAFDHIAKPFSMGRLTSVVEEALRRSKITTRLRATDTASFTRVLAASVREGVDVFAPALVGDHWTWRKASEQDLASGGLTLGPARATEPVKTLFLPPRGEVSRFFGEKLRPGTPERILVGARQCDLAALRILDHVFLEGPFEDPFYAARRERTLVVSADCTEPSDVCFCTLVEGKPYPERGFDLNLSEADGKLLVETGSEKGEKFVEKHKSRFREATDSERFARDEARKKVRANLVARVGNQQLDFPDKVRHIARGREEHPVWDARSADCVECGACNFVCPTCHCFYLLDVEEAGGVRRFVTWDSCQYPKFARVAGGANPRPRRAERLLNRFEKKFSFFCDTMDALGCTGCGRCVEVCAGKIDIREILKELAR